MAFDLEEQEKIDSIKAWWERFGNLITWAAIVVLVALLAWYGWKWYDRSQAIKALGYYEVVYNTNKQIQTQAQDLQRVQEAMKVLQSDYASSPFTGRAALLASETYVKNQQYTQARDVLLRAIDNAKYSPELQVFYQLQLVSVYADMQEFDKALAQLEKVPTGYEALFLDRKGDVLFTQHQYKEAKQSWSQALQQKGLLPEFASAIKIKLNVLVEDGN